MNNVFRYYICEYFLDLPDIFVLVQTCKEYYISLSPLLRRIQDMYKKWTPRRCYLEAKREKNMKIMKYYNEYKNNITEDEEIMISTCNNLSKLHCLFVYSIPKEEHLWEMLVYCIVYGSWDCYDEIQKYIYDIDGFFARGFYVACDVTLSGPEALEPYMKECCKRQLYRSQSFMHLYLSKLMELNMYDVIYSSKIHDTNLEELIVFLDDVRFDLHDFFVGYAFDTKSIGKLIGNKVLLSYYSVEQENNNIFIEQPPKPKTWKEWFLGI